jgi:hypothetical protein
MIIYINGVKQSNIDLKRFNQDLKNGLVKIVEIRRTPKNNVNIIVED